MQELQLFGNKIGDAGMKSFSEALASALPKLKLLGLDGNQIGDEGMKSLSEALASGVLAKLQVWAQNLATTFRNRC